MTATSSSTGWKNEAGSWSFPAASTQGIPDLQTGIHTRSAILWRICSSSSRITAVLPPDTRRRPSIFMLLSALPVPLFGYFDSFKTDSRYKIITYFRVGRNRIPRSAHRKIFSRQKGKRHHDTRSSDHFQEISSPLQ